LDSKVVDGTDVRCNHKIAKYPSKYLNTFNNILNTVFQLRSVESSSGVCTPIS